MQEIKAIKKKYKKKLKRLYKSTLNAPWDANFIVEQLVENLKYLRAYNLALSTAKLSAKKNLIISGIEDALAEYDAYMNCRHHYIRPDHSTSVVSTKIIYTDFSEKPLTDAQVLQRYKIEELIHWQKFWQIIQKNIKNWWS